MLGMLTSHLSGPHYTGPAWPSPCAWRHPDFLIPTHQGTSVSDVSEQQPETNDFQAGNLDCKVVTPCQKLAEYEPKE